MPGENPTPDVPVLELVFTEEDLAKGKGLKRIALVSRPAIEVPFVMLSAETTDPDTPVKVAFEMDEERGIAYGPALIPNLVIPRAPTEKYPQGFALFMSAETIRTAFYQFLKQGNTTEFNLEHKNGGRKVRAFIAESWIKDYPDHDKSHAFPTYRNLPVGTAFLGVQLEDETERQMVRDGLITGFSIEGEFGAEVVRTAKQTTTQPITKPMSKPAQPPAKKLSFVDKIRALFAEEDAAKPELAAMAVTVQADGGEAVIQLDDNMQVKCMLPDGTEGMLQLVAAAAEASKAPGDGTAPVANPDQVAAMKATFAQETKAMKADKEELEGILLKLAEQVAAQSEQLKQLLTQPAGSPIKPRAGKDNVQANFGRTGEAKPLSQKERIEQIEAERKEAQKAKK